MTIKWIEVGGVCMLTVAVAVHYEKHLHLHSYHGEPQGTQPLGTMVSTATGTAAMLISGKIPPFQFA